MLWMGDELGLLNDVGWADDPAHAGDNRWAHRPRLSWPGPTDDRTPIREGIASSARAVRRSPTCTPPGRPRSGTRATRVCCSSSAALLAGPLLAAANMTDRVAHVPSEVFYWLGMAGGELHDHLTGERPRFDGDRHRAPRRTPRRG